MRTIALLLLLLTLPLHANDLQHFANGKAALEAGEPEKAAGFFEKAVAAKPGSAEYHYFLGAAYGQWALQAGVLKQASLAGKVKAEFEQAVKLDPRHLDAHLGLISFYLAAPGFMGGSKEKARAQALEIAKFDSLQGHRAMARVHRANKKPELARQELVQAVREQPASAKAHFYLGGAYLIEENYPAALHEFESALRLDPSHMPSHFFIGVHAARSKSNYARGEEALRKYLAHKPAGDDPRHAGTWYTLGQIFEQQGRKADAKSAYQSALKLSPKAKDVIAALKRVS
jgi:cytochrome c-type biogenesis protein CcmH/NrfG